MKCLKTGRFSLSKFSFFADEIKRTCWNFLEQFKNLEQEAPQQAEPSAYPSNSSYAMAARRVGQLRLVSVRKAADAVEATMKAVMHLRTFSLEQPWQSVVIRYLRSLPCCCVFDGSFPTHAVGLVVTV